MIFFMNTILKLHLLAAEQEMRGSFWCLITCPRFLADFRIIYQWRTGSVQEKLIYVFGGNRRDCMGDDFTGPVG